MIRLASNKLNVVPTADRSTSSSSSSSSSCDSSDSEKGEPKIEKIKIVEKVDLQPNEVTCGAPPTIDNSLPIWEDYMPDLQKNIEELTKALGGYLRQNKRTARSSSTSSSESCGKTKSTETNKKLSELSPPAGVVADAGASIHQVKKNKKKRTSPVPTTSSKIVKTVVVSKKKKENPPKNIFTAKNKKQLLQLAQKLTLALEQNF